MTTPPSKPLTYLAGAALVTLVASPVVQNLRPPAERRDGFPLSHYPMFTARRKATGTVHHLLGITADGTEHVLHHRHAGIGGLNQVRRQITRRVRSGDAQELADRVARSVARSAELPEREVVRVRVVSSKHVYDDFFAGDRTPVRRRVRAEAEVTRPGSIRPTTEVDMP
ncbi:hypothetical protein [Kytococcus sp. Marseille-QA3725]